MIKENTNPYANPDGSPKDGQEAEFFEWAKKKDQERLNQLPEDERNKEIEAQRSLNDRMQS